MPYSNTTYGPNNIITQASGMPVTAGHQGGAMDDYLKELMELKLAKLRKQNAPPTSLLGAGSSQNPVSMAPQAQERQAPNPNAPRANPGIPIYTKQMSGFNMGGGNVRAMPWEQGANFSGYIDPRMLPSQANFADEPRTASGGQSGAGITQQRPQQTGGALPQGEDPGVAFRRAQLEAARTWSDRDYEQRTSKERA